MLFVAESNLLDFFIWTLEATDTFVVNPDSDSRFRAFLDADNPILVAVHGHNIVGVSLHEDLLSSLNVPPDEDAASTVIHIVVPENEVRVVQGGVRKHS